MGGEGGARGALSQAHRTLEEEEDKNKNGNRLSCTAQLGAKMLHFQAKSTTVKSLAVRVYNLRGLH